MLTWSKLKGRTVRRGYLKVRHWSPKISRTTTCFFLASPSDRAVATLDPGCSTLKLLSDSAACGNKQSGQEQLLLLNRPALASMPAS